MITLFQLVPVSLVVSKLIVVVLSLLAHWSCPLVAVEVIFWLVKLCCCPLCSETPGYRGGSFVKDTGIKWVLPTYNAKEYDFDVWWTSFEHYATVKKFEEALGTAKEANPFQPESRDIFYFLRKSLDRSEAVATALMSIDLNPWDSNSLTA